MSKSQDFRKAAADQASAAAEYGQQALKDGMEHAQGWLKKTQKQVGPALKDAKVRSADFAARKFDAIEPHVRNALDKVSPAVDAARSKVADEFLPRVSESLHSAAEHPLKVAETIKPKKKKSVGKGIVKFLAIGTVVAGVVAAIRHFLAPKDDGWTAHEPSRAYVNNNDTFATAAKVSETPKSTAADPSPEEKVEQPEAQMVDEGGPVVDDAVTNAVDSGSYKGENPPEGFIIKGNERSMKYHVPGTGGYERTIAEIWFATEEAAQAAGFTKAQR
ncbi:hypothetical protein [uncultured Tessaracoccus sp.]|uniref:sunset domain-containing protein n=1 Tax=uncultured Tessaracoccus sp. TaxID=905023 RepID=UPI0026169CD8|nr:hypothetical protein [uncultured Tessaracoccus sp.]